MVKKAFLVIGVGRFGSAVARALYEQGNEVVIIDNSEEDVERLMDHVTHAVIADATDEEVLRRVGVANFDAVIVSIGANFEANVLATVAAKSLGAKRIISKVTGEMSAAVLTKVGADEVIRPEHDMGTRLAQQLTTPALVDAFDLGTLHSVIEVAVPKNLVGSLADLRLPNRFNVQVIAVNRGGEVVASPGATFELKTGDRVVLIGSNEALHKFRDHLSG